MGKEVGHMSEQARQVLGAKKLLVTKVTLLLHRTVNE